MVKRNDTRCKMKRKDTRKAPKWMKGLNKWDKAHLRESMDGRLTLAKLKNNAASGLCPQCVSLAKRLDVL